MVIVRHVGIAPEHAGLSGLFLPLTFTLATWATAYLFHLALPWMDWILGILWMDWILGTKLWTRNFRSLWGAVQTLIGYAIVLSVLMVLLPALIYTLKDFSVFNVFGALASLGATRLLTSRGDGGEQQRLRLPIGVRRVLLGVVVALFLVFMVALIATFLVEQPAVRLAAIGGGLTVLLLVLGFVVDKPLALIGRASAEAIASASMPVPRHFR